MEQMKNSGISYLGIIPLNWEVKRLKYCVTINNGREYSDIEVDEGGFPVIGSGGEFARASKYQYAGEAVLLGRKGTIDKPLYINDLFWCVDTMFYAIPKRNMCAKYVYYCALNIRFEYYMTSTALPSMTQTDLGDEKICVPPIEVQQAIADFLDSKCNQIDGIISDIQNQIEILKKYKKSLITETVTKGLDTGVPMKDSGVEWIGEIPEHWDVKKVKYGVSICNGKEIESEEGEIPVYGTGGTFKNTNKSLYKGESVLLGRKGTIDKPLFVDDEFWTVDTAFYTIMKSDLLVKLFYYYACCFDYKYYQTGSAVPSMTQSDLGSILIPEIPHKEQQEIVNFLDTKCNQIDTLIESKQTQLEKMQGYRKSLIYEYVTGKKRVT